MLDYFQDLQKLKTNHKFGKNLRFGLSSLVKKVSNIILAIDNFLYFGDFSIC
jgi:hypothetical protein